MIHTSALPINNAALDNAIEWYILKVKDGYAPVSTFSSVVRSGSGVDPERFCLDQGAYIMKVGNTIATWSGTFTLNVGQNQTYGLTNVYRNDVIYFQTTPFGV
jgi:hypothetical protein